MIKFTTGVFATLLASASFALDKTIDVSVLYKEGGTTFERSKALAETLEELGWTVNFVPKGNCHNMLNYVDAEKRPLIFLNSDSSITEVAALGCDTKPAKENFVTMLYKRDSVLCGNKGQTVDSLLEKFRNEDRITVAATTFYPEKVITAIGDATGKDVDMIPYNKSTVAIKGQIAGDSDFYLGGMQPKTMDNVELSCLVHTKDKDIDGMIRFADAFEGYAYPSLATHYFAHGYHLTDELREALAVDLQAAMETAGWNQYITTSQMTSARDLQHIDVNGIIKSLDDWAQ